MRRIRPVVLAVLSCWGSSAQTVTLNPQADLQRWAEAQERRVGYNDLLPSPVPKDRKAVWSLEVRRGDIYGMSANRIVFWLDDHGEAWVRDYEPRLESLGSQFIRLKKEHPNASDQDLDRWLRVEDRWGDGDTLASLHLREVARLWSKVPPATSRDNGVFFESDIWTEFEVQGAPAAVSGGFDKYAERLGTLLPEAGALPPEALKKPYGAFLAAGDWIQSVRDQLFAIWLEAHAKDDYQSVISDAELKSRGLDLLDLACAWDYEPLALALIRRGVPPNTLDSWSYPFSRACETGRVDFVRLLVRAGADPNLPDQRQDTPLMSAANSGSMELVQYLLDQKADAKAKNADGVDAMFMAVANAEHPLRIARLLFNHGADPNARDSGNGMTTLHESIENTDISEGERTSLIKLLLAHGASPWAKDNAHRTPLDLALERKISSVIDLLQLAMKIPEVTPSP